YGNGCKGNYKRLSNLAKKTPVFPKLNNKRSMIFIDNLSEFIKNIIDDFSHGIFFPQNSEYVNTTEMVRLIAEVHGNKIWLTKVINPYLKASKINIINKVFGDLVYDKKISECSKDYNLYGLRESIVLTEMRSKL